MHTIFTLSQVGDLGYSIQHCYHTAKLLLFYEAAARTVSNTKIEINFVENNIKRNNLATILTRLSNFYFEHLWNIGNITSIIAIDCRNWLPLSVEREVSEQEEHRLLNGFPSRFHSS